MALFHGEQSEQRPEREMQHGGLGSRKRFLILIRPRKISF